MEGSDRDRTRSSDEEWIRRQLWRYATVFDSDPETARLAVSTIGTASRETPGEMRRLLRGSRAEVTVDSSATRLIMTIPDSRPLAPILAPGNGHGLIGMCERARIYHGTLTAEALERGGFRVEMVVPLGNATAVTSLG